MNIIDVRKKLPTHPLKKYQMRPMSTIYYIAIHHSLTDDIPGGGDVEAFARYHVDHLDWPGIGYHYVVDADGTIYKCHSAEIWSYHVGQHNRFALGVCLVGDFRQYEPPTEQYQATIELVKQLMNAYGIKPQNVLGHSEFEGYAWKKCPCIDMDKLRRDIIASKG
jgi:N-acetylmuramoyl-L-alanine amidase